MKRFSLTIALILFLGGLSFSIIVLPGNVSAKTFFVGGSGPGNYSSIQSAIDSADAGDTIYVYSGTYYEGILVDKTLSIVGENRDTTIVDGDGASAVVEVTADWVNITGVTVTGGSGGQHGGGIGLFGSSNCRIENNKAISNRRVGVYLSYADSNTVASNILRENYEGILLYYSHRNNILNNDEEGMSGVYLWYSTNNTIAGNTAVDGHRGFLLEHSDDNIVENNKASQKIHEGIYVQESHRNVISYNTFSANRPAIHLDSSTLTVVTGNKMVDNGIFIYGEELEHWNSHTIDDTNTANGKPVYYWKDTQGGRVPSGAGQVILANCTGVIVENQIVSGVYVGIEFGMSHHNVIANNTASSNRMGSGIILYNSDSNTVANNTASSNHDAGVILIDSHVNTITNNIAHNNDRGIDLHFSNDNIISHSDLARNDFSIYFLDSQHNLVANNSMLFGGNGIYFMDSDNNKVHNNNVSDTGRGISPHDSDNNVVVGNTIMNSNEGVSISVGNNNIIVNNDISHNKYGILNSKSAFNVISSNNVRDNEYGIYNAGSCWKWNNPPNCRNDFSENHISYNDYGINSYLSKTAIITSNYVANNLEGIHLENTDHHAIYHNDIVDNTLQAYDDKKTNRWDDGYPSGGNYWSDYSGVDFYSGPGQDIQGSDGIGDTPHVIDPDSKDRYPLMEPIVQPPVRALTLDIDPDTLNARSRGRWITAYLATENAMAESIVASSLVLNDVVRPTWWNVQNDTTLMVKFDRAAVQAIVPVSDKVDIKVTGQWKDGESFELHDEIRVIDPGGYRMVSRMFSSREIPISYLREQFDVFPPFGKPMEGFRLQLQD